MHGRTRTSRATPIVAPSDPRVRPLRRTGAVTWVDGRHALVAHTTPKGADLVEVLPDVSQALGGAYFARVAEEIGNRERVLVLGPDAYRIELERQYVALFGHPDRLRDGSGGIETPGEDLLARLASLTEP
jgi:hypothetical protein